MLQYISWSGNKDLQWVTSFKYLGINLILVISQFDEDIIENFSSKDFPEFWKCWKQKCRRYQTKNAKISGFDNDKDTADGFAKHFRLCILILP